MKNNNTFHMDIDDFRKQGKLMVDFIADYYENIETFPVKSKVKPGEIKEQLPDHAPSNGESFESIINDVTNIIIPGITHWQSPNFFAYFPSNTSFPSILGELLSAGFGVQGMLWETSPACTELEIRVLDWLVDMLELPAKFRSGNAGGGVIQDSASSAALCALLSAREKITDYNTNISGCNSRITVYASTQTHSSIEKAVMIAGIGSKNLRLIDVDETLSMRPEALARKIRKDKDNGFIPAFVCATVGTTSSNAIDPIEEIGKICRHENVWMHVDAAMAGTAAICHEYRYILDGIEYADSYCFNPHKWMFTNFDCDCFYVADKKALIKTLSILPEYLKNKTSESDNIIDYRDWQIPLGRRFRSLKLWFVIRYYGVEGLKYHIRKHIKLAKKFVSWVKKSPVFQLAAPAPLNLVCFRHINGDDFNRKLLASLNEKGQLYMTHTVIDNLYTIRMCISQTNTEERHIKRAWEIINKTARELDN